MRVSIAVLIAGCSSPSAPGPDAAEPINDVRAAIPAPDPSFLDLISPELRIEPGQEAIYCYYTSNPLGRFGTDYIEAIAREGEHHIALRQASVRRPDGTFEDCTATQDSLQLGDFFGNDLPAGWAAEIPADTQFVVEMHYLNAGELPMLARDVIRIHRVPDAQITKWVHAMHLRAYDLVIGPGESSRAFECTVPQALDLYQYWGHQHELGKQLTVDLTPPAEPTRRIYDAHWGVDPAVWGTTSSALPLAAGSKLRVTCTWHAAGTVVAFPDEMCAFGGIVEGSAFSCAPASAAP